MIIIAIDPGLVSGLAVWDSADIQGITLSEVHYQDIGDRLEEAIVEFRQQRVEFACERYTMRPGVKTAQPEALKIMGVLEHLGKRHRIPLHYYLPDSCKGTMKNPRLKDAGWYRVTKDGHSNDGARVLGTHLFNQYPEVAGRLFGI